MDQSTLIARVAGRLNIDSNDPIYTSLTSYVDEGLHYLESSAPDGWPWMRRTLTLTTTASTQEYTFSTLGALVTPNITVGKILDCRVLRQSTFYEAMDLINPNTVDVHYGSTVTGFPEAWYVEGQTLSIYPNPDAAYTVKVRVVYTETDLGGGSSTPVLPVVFHGAIIDAACLIAYQRLQDTGRVEEQRRLIEDWVQKMRRYGQEYASAPHVMVREAL